MGFLMAQNRSALAELRRYRRRLAELQARLDETCARDRAKGDAIMVLSRHWSQLETDLMNIAEGSSLDAAGGGGGGGASSSSAALPAGAGGGAADEAASALAFSAALRSGGAADAQLNATLGWARAAELGEGSVEAMLRAKCGFALEMLRHILRCPPQQRGTGGGADAGETAPGDDDGGGAAGDGNGDGALASLSWRRHRELEAEVLLLHDQLHQVSGSARSPSDAHKPPVPARAAAAVARRPGGVL